MLCRAFWPLHPWVEPCPRIRVWPLMSPWEKKRPGFRPSQHLWKCSRVTTTKSTCQRPAQWTSSPRLHRLQLPHTPNELVWMPICLQQWKGKRRYEETEEKKINKDISFSAVAEDICSPPKWQWHRSTVLDLKQRTAVWKTAKVRLRYPRHQPWPLSPKWNCPSLGSEFKDGHRRRATESRVLTRQSVYIPEGNFSPWRGSRAGGPTCRWGLSVVDWPAGAVAAAPGHVGGT